ncbi:ArsR/SmtB family transcription factor [Flavobacterium ponti]|jgi:DNA-binding transcriptional ArsR family regulator|uniref:ArsR/SmtB family transcription factor n=1 Tax=Flavobacterium ponti TaxID=665133 RepID=A0ABV9P3Z9_9FLAO
MGLTKRIGFKEDINNIAEVFKALGHPARIQIMNILLSKESCSCGNIVEILPLAQSTVSNHLLELKKANLVNITFSGKSSIYSVEKDKLNVLNQFISDYIDNLGPETFTKKKTTHKSKTISISEKMEDIKPAISKKKKSSTNLKQYNYEFTHKK